MSIKGPITLCNVDEYKTMRVGDRQSDRHSFEYWVAEYSKRERTNFIWQYQIVTGCHDPELD